MHRPNDRPRLFADQREIEKRRLLIAESHIAPLTDFARLLRSKDVGNIPDFDPWDGGVNARVLFLFEKPGPKAFKSGFISRNNDDKSAENTFKFMNDAGIPREQSCIWNIIPGWNGTVKITATELNAGVEAFNRLINLLPNLAVVMLVGKKAGKAKPQISQAGLHVLESTHPSPVNYAYAKDAWAKIPDQWAEAKKFL